MGEFVVRWTLPDGSVAEEEVNVGTVTVLPGDGTNYRPGVGDVATALKGYTKGKYGGEENGGTFTATTTPTADEVDDMISSTLPLVAAKLGSTVPDELAQAAKSVATLRAAMAVVRSLMRQSDGNERDLYELLRDEYRDAVADYDAAARGHDSASEAGGSNIGNISIATVYNL